MTLKALALHIKECLQSDRLKIAGNGDMIVTSAAVCTGSGSGLMKDFFSCGADVYISGDLHYHDARNAENEGFGLIDIGHFVSEHLMVEMLSIRLRAQLEALKTDVEVFSCEIEKDPFYRV